MVFLDKSGFPVELIKGAPFKNLLRLLVHTRSINRGVWDSQKFEVVLPGSVIAERNRLLEQIDELEQQNSEYFAYSRKLEDELEALKIHIKDIVDKMPERMAAIGYADFPNSLRNALNDLYWCSEGVDVHDDRRKLEPLQKLAVPSDVTEEDNMRLTKEVIDLKEALAKCESDISKERGDKQKALGECRKLRGQLADLRPRDPFEKVEPEADA